MTNYPRKIDDNSSLPTVIDLVTPVQGVVFNRLRDTIVAVETELGTSPSGVYGTVASRFLNIENTIGNLRIIELQNDLGGTLENPQVIGIHGRPISDAPLTSGDVLMWNGIAWVPSPALVDNVFIAGGDLAGNGVSQTVIGINGRPVSATAPTIGQVLEWDGTKWAPTSGEAPSGPATGDLSGNYPSPTVSKIDGYSVPAGGYIGNALQISGPGILSYAAINLAGGSNYISGVLPTGNQALQSITLTGDATSSGGTTASASTSVVAIRGKTLASSLASIGAGQNGYVLTWVNGSTDWEAQPAPATTSVTMGGDISGSSSSAEVIGILNKALPSLPVSDGYLNYTGSAWQFSALTIPTTLPPSGAASGDLSGSYPGPTVAKIQGNSVDSTSLGATQDGYILTWKNGSSEWIAQPAPATTSVTMAGDVTGSSNANTVVKIQGISVSNSTPLDGYVLTYSSAGSDWIGKINNSALAIYGDGSDGAFTCDGTATFASVFSTTGSAPNFVYTQIREPYFTNFTISSGKIVNCGGFRLFVNGTFTCNGNYNSNGGNASSSVDGVAGGGGSSSAWRLAGGYAGANGGTQNAVGGDGSAGQSANFGPGSIYPAIPPTANYGGWRDLSIMQGWIMGTGSASPTPINIRGGNGGSRAGRFGTCGGGGGVTIVIASTLAGSGSITANGGQGHLDNSYGDSGGNGGGGLVVLVTNSNGSTVSVTANGGAAYTAGGNPTVLVGGTGIVLQFTA